jgi:hypothetical protein
LAVQAVTEQGIYPSWWALPQVSWESVDGRGALGAVQVAMNHRGAALFAGSISISDGMDQERSLDPARTMIDGDPPRWPV